MKHPSNFIQFKKEISQRIEEIKNDNIHGATHITKQVLELINEFIHTYEKKETKIFLHQLQSLLQKIIHAQPTMAPLFTYGNQLLIEILPLQDFNSIKNTILTYNTSFNKRLEKGSQEIKKHVLDIVKNDMKIFTYSYSSTVLEVISYLKENNIDCQIFCSVSQPKKEGILFSEKVSNLSIETTLMTDAALFSNTRNADIILIGADALSQEGLTNKIGTKVLIQQAKNNNISSYALCTKEKIVPYSYVIPQEPIKHPNEIINRNIPKLKIINYYFDHTPINYLQGIITQNGIQTPKEIIAYMKSLKIHPQLQTSSQEKVTFK